MLVVHQFEHEVSGMYPEVAHGAGLAAIWCSWARYVYSANIPRWLQYSANVWNLDVDYEHPEKTIETAINMQEQYYKSIGMPTDLRSLGVKEEDLERLALKCTRNKSRNLPGYKTLEYEDILNIYRMAYQKNCRVIEQNIDKLTQCLETGNVRDYTIEVHALKNT